MKSREDHTTSNMSFNRDWNQLIIRTKDGVVLPEDLGGGRLKEGEVSKWEYVPEYKHFRIRGPVCEITLEKRPDYCDRGRVMAKVFSFDFNALPIDPEDCWSPGRCYFNLQYAIEEIESWMKARKQYITACVKCEEPLVFDGVPICNNCGLGRKE